MFIGVSVVRRNVSDRLALIIVQVGRFRNRSSAAQQPCRVGDAAKGLGGHFLLQIVPLIAIPAASLPGNEHAIITDISEAIRSECEPHNSPYGRKTKSDRGVNAQSRG